MIKLYNMDCMEYMKGLKDNEFDLAIVDPPYGIGESGTKAKGRNRFVSTGLYGTRDAAANFQKEVTIFMMKCGFTVGRYNPCTYFHKCKGLRTLVHGDDFVTSGQRRECDWFKKQLETRFSIKTKIVGLRDDEEKEERILNRVIRVTSQGWEMEADQRHADIIVLLLMRRS